MNEEIRIKRDFKIFEENVSRFISSNDREEKILDLARRYYEDAKYYLKNGDLFTAFGCINYAHGLLDALIKLK